MKTFSRKSEKEKVCLVYYTPITLDKKEKLYLSWIKNSLLICTQIFFSLFIIFTFTYFITLINVYILTIKYWIYLIIILLDHFSNILRHFTELRHWKIFLSNIKKHNYVISTSSIEVEIKKNFEPISVKKRLWTEKHFMTFY